MFPLRPDSSLHELRDARGAAQTVLPPLAGHSQVLGGGRSGRALASSNAARYYVFVIRSFRDPDAERIFHREAVRKFPPSLLRAALRKLVMLDAATSLADLRVPPANRLEKLTSGRLGQHSIRINDQWRLCFRWVGADAYDVEIVDYH